MHFNEDVNDKHPEPAFNHSNAQIAGYEAVLKVLTVYTRNGGEDVNNFALRSETGGEGTFVDTIVQQEAEATNADQRSPLIEHKAPKSETCNAAEEFGAGIKICDLVAEEKVMQADFLDAHQRHWDDAERLFQVQRWASSDHLYGMAAECGLKQLMMKFGMAVDPSTNTPVESKDRKHINLIWIRFETYRSGHHQGTGYALPSSNPFLDWDVSQRYANQSHFDQARAQSHQSGAQVVRKMVKKAQREGLLI
jgi:hypothetical protein